MFKYKMKKKRLILVLIVLMLILGFSSKYVLGQFDEEEEEEEPECYNNADCPEFCKIIPDIHYYNGWCDVDVCSYTTHTCKWGCSGITCAEFAPGDCPGGGCNEDTPELDCGEDYCSGNSRCYYQCDFPLDGYDCEGNCQQFCTSCGASAFCSGGGCIPCGGGGQRCCQSPCPSSPCISGRWCDSGRCCYTGDYWDGSVCRDGETCSTKWTTSEPSGSIHWSPLPWEQACCSVYMYNDWILDWTGVTVY